MAINISHPTNTIDGQDVLNLKSGNSENIELNPDSGLVNVNGDINITGNFRVQGTTTTVNSTTTTIVDPIIALGTDEDGNPVSYNDGKDRGISFFYNNGANKTGFFGFDSSNNDFRFIPDATITNEIVSGSDGTITINRLNSADIYTDYLDASADVSVHGNLTVDNNTTTTTLDAGNLNVTDNVISSNISGNIVLDPGEDSIDVSNANIINLAEPNNSQDAATKNYVDQKSNAISVLNIAGDFGTGSVDLETGTFTLNGTQYQIETSVTNDVITFSLPTNLIAPGSLEVTNNLVVNENTSTLTLDAGDLNITTNVISSDISGDIIIDSGEDAIQLIGNTNVTGNLDVSGNISLGGNITIGDQTIDTINVVADFTSNLIPQQDITYDLGSETKRWNNVYAGTINADLIGNITGNVTGQVSDISNHDTSELAEDPNATVTSGTMYFTQDRARNSVSAVDAGGDGSFSYNSLSGEFTYTGPSSSETQAHFTAGTGLTYTAGEFKITDSGVTSGEYGDASNIPIITVNAQGQITTISTVSVAGVTDFEYNTTNGDLTISTADGNSFTATVTLDPFTTDNLTEGNNLYYTSERVISELSAGTGLTYTAGEFKITDTGVSSGVYGNSSTIPIITINAQGQITAVSTTSVAGVTDFQYDLANGDLTISTADGSFFTATVTLDPFTTDNLVEGEINQYYTTERVRSELSAGTGVYYDNTTGVISIGQWVDTDSDVSFNSVTVATNTTTTTLDAGDLNIIDNVISSDVSGDIRIESGADTIQLVGDTDVTGNFSVSNDAVIYGNLTVQGTTTSVNSTTVDIADLNLTLGKGSANSAEANGAGITVDGANATITYLSQSDTWNLNKTLNVDGDVNATTFNGDLVGNVTGQVSDISNHTTDELDEGETNLYYTTARTRSDVNAGTGLTYTQATGEFKITDTGVTFGEYGDASNIPVITVNAQGQITTISTVAVAGVTDFEYNTTNGDLTISTADGGSFVATVTLDPFTTDNLVEGDNLYYTTARANEDFDTRLATKTTTDLTEGDNLYYTNTRARLSISVSDLGGDGSLSYDNETGIITYTGPDDNEIRAHFSAGTGLTYTAGEFKITDTAVTSGSYGDSSNIPVLTINAQGQITAASTVAVAGVTDFEYNTTNGDLTISTADGNSFVATVTLDPFTTDNLLEGETNQYYTTERVRSELSAGTGVYYDNTTGVISIGQWVDTDSDVTFNSVSVTTNTTTTTLDAGDLNITTNVISSDVSGDIRIESGADNIELVGNTNVTGDLTVSGIIYGDLTGNVTGQVSDISNHNTDELAEGETNLYYTDERARLSVSATTSGTGHGNLQYNSTSGVFTLTKVSVADVRSDVSATKVSGDGNFTYDNTTGIFSYTGPSASETQAHFSAGTGLTYTAGEFKITDTAVTAGSYGDASNIPVLTINAQGQITDASTIAVAGVTDFEYNTTNGDLTISTADGGSFVATVTLDPFTTDNLDEGNNHLYYTTERVRSEISAGTGVYYDNTTGVISIGQSVDTTSDVTFANVTVSNNTTTLTLDAGDLNITTNVISSDIAGDIIIDSGADTIQLIGDTDVTGNFSVSANAIIYGDLTVQGTTTSINSTNTEITDNTIVLNQGETGAGVSKGTSGIEVARGSLFNASWKWNELTGRWEAKEGTNLTAVAVSEIDAGNLNISGNTISSTDTNGNINLTPNGTGQVLYKNQHVATHDDAIAYAIVFGG